MEKATKNMEKAPKALQPERAPKSPKAAASKNAPIAHGVGRRKSAVARVWLKRGNGSLVVNEKNYAQYFDTEITRLAAYSPFKVYAQSNNWDVVVNVIGGGLSGQADAVKLAVARAFVEMNPDLRPAFRQNDLLTSDSRLKERKKYGQKAARRKFQFVKR